jgi:hypothetical protein
VDHVIPANSLPPLAIWRAGFSLLAWVDALLRVLTPPNLSLFRELMGYVHTVEIYTAAELGLADAIFRAGVPLADEGVPLAALARAAAPACEDEADAAAPRACAAVELRVARLLRALAAFGVYRVRAPRRRRRRGPGLGRGAAQESVRRVAKILETSRRKEICAVVR